MTSAPARSYIRDLEPAQRIKGVYAIFNAQLGRTRSDKTYLRCMIGDRTGEVSARMWSIDEATYNRLPRDGFVWLEGETQPFHGDLQVILSAVDGAEPSNEELRELLPTSKRDPEEMFAQVTALLATLEHPAMQALAQTYLTDAHLMDAFKRCPAAKSLHHAYLGGLLEHTLTLMQLADRVCPLYPKINRDLVMMGVFLHDLGKTRELEYDKAFAYTDRGQLVGHIVEGAVMLRGKLLQMIHERGQRLPHGTALVLEHIVLSHHGRPEHGAVKTPASPEAILVAMLDNLDARTFMAVHAARPDRTSKADLGGNFTDHQRPLETKLYRPDPLDSGTNP